MLIVYHGQHNHLKINICLFRKDNHFFKIFLTNLQIGHEYHQLFLLDLLVLIMNFVLKNVILLKYRLI